MFVAKYYRNSDVWLEEMEEPKIGAGEVKVRVVASGICGSDVMEWYRIKKAPLVLGHEITGDICETGANVKNFKVGQRVFVSHHVPCNTCNYCLNGHYTACNTLHTTNFFPGGFSQYLRVPEINVDRGIYLLPETMSYDEGVFIEPLACVVRGWELANIKPGGRVMIIGSGISGLLFIKTARALGAGLITAVDINDYRLSHAKNFGADKIVNSANMPEGKVDDDAYDCIILCTGSLSAVKTAFSQIDRGGRIIFFAVAKPGVDVPVPINEMWRNEIVLQTSYGASPKDLDTALKLIASKRITVNDMITHKFGLKDTGKGFKLVADANESLKIIIEPQK